MGLKSIVLGRTLIFIKTYIQKTYYLAINLDIQNIIKIAP